MILSSNKIEINGFSKCQLPQFISSRIPWMYIQLHSCPSIATWERTIIYYNYNYTALHIYSTLKILQSTSLATSVPRESAQITSCSWNSVLRLWCQPRSCLLWPPHSWASGVLLAWLWRFQIPEHPESRPWGGFLALRSLGGDWLQPTLLPGIAKTSSTLPDLYLFVVLPPDSRIGCYVTIFQNISNLRDVFYREMSKVRNPWPI